MTRYLETLGAEVVPFPGADLCCGSYQVLANPEAAEEAASNVLSWAAELGAEALALTCPLCDFNLGKRQDALLRSGKLTAKVPTFYFTQLLALALGLKADVCRFDLNDRAAVELLKRKDLPIHLEKEAA
jgi:heterodisulfide reductase subunit B